MPPRPRHSRGIPVSRRTAPAKDTPYGPRDEQEAVVERHVSHQVLQHRGVLWEWHDNDSRRNKAGLVDRIIIGPRGVLWRELKSDTGHLTKEQADVGRRLLAGGQDFAVWTPEDMRRGTIINQLNWLARRRPDATGGLRGDLAKTLYLMNVTSDVPLAGIHWDAGSRHVDRGRWLLNADEVLRVFAGLLPRTDEEVLAWLREHRQGESTSPVGLFGALIGDLQKAVGGDGVVA